jgi:hypothetical protein
MEPTTTAPDPRDRSEIIRITPGGVIVEGPTPRPEPPKPRRPLRDWFNAQPPAVRHALAGAVVLGLSQVAPWLVPLIRAIAGGAGQ